MRYLACLLVWGCLLTSFASAEAIAPDWRGDDNTTFQSWTFDNANNPADLAPGSNNTYGTPTATIHDFTGLNLGPAWQGTYNIAGFEDALGVWKIYAGAIALDIPNTENTSPDSWKEIWLQITYYDPSSDNDLSFGINPIAESVQRLDREVLSTGFYRDTYEIIIRPNPLSEIIAVTPTVCNLYVDAITVDTLCVPEPSTLVLLAVGLGMVFLKWRATK